MLKATLILTAFLTLPIGSGCILQPIEKIEKHYNFIDMNQPALRLAKPVKAELLEKVNGEWQPIGVGVVPAGAYIKGRQPQGAINGE